MANKGKKLDGRSLDMTFSWMLTTLGAEWQQWQELAAEWMATQKSGVQHKRKALTIFFESYVAEYAPYAISNLDLFFKGYLGIGIYTSWLKTYPNLPKYRLAILASLCSSSGV